MKSPLSVTTGKPVTKYMANGEEIQSTTVMKNMANGEERQSTTVKKNMAQ